MVRASRNASVIFIFVVLLLDTLGIGVIIPVLPSLVASFAHGAIGHASRYYGAFIAVYAAMQLVCAPVMGALSDRFGRRPVILCSLLGAGLDYALLALAPSLGWLFVGRVLAGATAASFATATAYIADVTPVERRAQSFGLVGLAFGVGFILGPAIGGLMGAVSLRAPFLVAAALSFLNLMYGLFVLPESLAAKDRRAFSFRRANPLGALRRLRRSPTLASLSGTLLCIFLSQKMLESVWALHAHARFAWSTLEVGLSLTAIGVASAVVQGGLVRVAVPRLGERRALLVGLTLSGLAFLAFGATTQGWMMYVWLIPFALGGIAGPALQALMSREASASEQGELQGSLSSLQSVSAIMGPLLGTRLFEQFSPAAAVPHLPGAPFFAGSLLDGMALLLALRLFARLPPAPPIGS